MKKLRLITLLLAVLPVVGFATDDTNVIYGDDDRNDVYDSEVSSQRTLAKSTVLITDLENLSSLDDSTFKLETEKLGESRDLCKDERFYNQPSGGWCSGFLIADNLIATAGHCAANVDCDEMAFVFDYAYTNSSNESLDKIKKSNVFTCKKVIANQIEDGTDFAIIELDRKVPNRTPLVLNKSSDEIQKNSPLFVIGHPNGIPTKIAGGASVRKNNKRKNFFIANLDTYGGNSGSAVFNTKSNKVEGILVRGETDYKFNRDDQCFRSKQCDNDECRGEDVIKIKNILGEF